jgi:cobalt/nickel transport system permease protein
MLLHIGGFRLDTDSDRQTPWHRLVPRTRILCALLLVFGIALTPNGQWLTWGIYSLGVVAIALISQVSILELLKRIVVEFLFVGLVLFGALFRSGGEVIWQWGFLRITTEGVIVLGSVGLKMVLSLTMLNILVLTTAIPDLLHALTELRVPKLLVAILFAMHRYIQVLVDELTSMKKAAQSRNLFSNPQRQRLIIGNIIGSLFIRTLERGEQVHQAMLARGFTGLPPVTEMPRSQRRDRRALILIGGLVLLGQVCHFQWG